MTLAVPRKNQTKAKMQAGGIPVGVFLFDPSPRLVEVCGALGFDFVTIDGEGSAIDHILAEELARAAEAVGITPIIRPLNHDPKSIGLYLDSGFQGILMPNVDSAAQARDIVAAAKFQPEGNRGIGTSRAALYGYVRAIGEFVAAANDEILVFGMIEHVAAMKELSEIFETPGFDGFDIGPWDLAASMGHAGKADHPDVQSTIAAIMAEAAKHHCAMGYTASSPTQAEAALSAGYRRMSVSFNGVMSVALRSVGDRIRTSAEALPRQGVRR